MNAIATPPSEIRRLAGVARGLMALDDTEITDAEHEAQTEEMIRQETAEPGSFLAESDRLTAELGAIAARR